MLANRKIAALNVWSPRRFRGGEMGRYHYKAALLAISHSVRIIGEQCGLEVCNPPVHRKQWHTALKSS